MDEALTPAQSAFERFVARSTLGEPTDAELKRWIAGMVTGQDA